eukprot:TRINITY_DN9251_c0_g1_i1.p1 TRINITY_DN9251_c0_g1~~TRINITY_DN9251_c0_g1_i1.p1  ORF type:complete len:289 (+),score=23.11 TRINITY_DN9251_c0_g1_i1:50-916(+)
MCIRDRTSSIVVPSVESIPSISKPLQSKESPPVIKSTETTKTRIHRSSLTNHPQHRLDVGACVQCEATEFSFTYDEHSSKRDQYFEIISRKIDRNEKILAGSISIPRNTFEPGCTLTLNQTVLPSDTQSSSSMECESELQVTSIAVELHISCQSKRFKNPLSIELNSLLVDTSAACLAYNQNPSSSKRWECLEKKHTKQHHDYISFQSETTHFTTFAVLLEATNPCNRWIWIVSLVMVGSCIIIMLLIAVIYYRSRWFRAVVGGFEADSISVVIKKAPDLSKVARTNN